MKRWVQKFRDQEFDVLIIGGGIYGACVAWDAALRGLSVALVEKDDFGAGTSANSLKIMHGGLRYLQDANLKLVRAMIKERAAWMRIAPHLVHPLPFIMPTFGYFTRSKLALRTALALNDGFGFDRNLNMDKQKKLPNGRILSKSSTLEKMRWIDPQATGGAMWHDAQVYNSERLLIGIVRSAAMAGATVANYVKVNGFQMDGQSISTVNAEDKVNGQRLDIRSKIVINCSGAWAAQVLGLLGTYADILTLPISAAINLVIRKLPLDCAIGFPSKQQVANEHNQNKKPRILFIVPWQDYAIAGTWHTHFDGLPQNFQVSEELIQSYIDELNASYPIIDLKRQDIYRVNSGFLPLDERGPRRGEVKLLRESQVHDHVEADGVNNLITVTGVKYTTARKTAQETVDLILKKLNRPPIKCQTDTTAVKGGDIAHFDDYLEQVVSFRPAEISEQTMTHLVYSYGTDYSAILDITTENPNWINKIAENSPVLKAEIIYAARHEMAQTLADSVYRRTPLGIVENLSKRSMHSCAKLMAVEKGWDQDKLAKEVIAARAQFSAGRGLISSEVS
jgi:glycerol-3-phosphate dehydrogenase